MRRALFASGLALAAVLLAAPTIAAAGEKVIWAENLDEAWQLAQEHQRPMLVFVTRSNCKYCVRMKSQTYANEQVAREVNNRFVPVMVTSQTAQQLVTKLDIKSFPTTLVITPDYYIVEQVKGYVSPTELYRRLGTCEERIAQLPATASKLK